MNKVILIGYSAPGAAERIDVLLRDADGNPTNVRLMDTRQHPWSPNPRWTRSALVKKYGCEQYHHIGTLLGNANHRIPGAPIKLIDPVRGIAALCAYLKAGHDLILLCTCVHVDPDAIDDDGHADDPEVKICHNSVIIRLLLKAMPEVEIILPVQPAQVVQATLF